MSASGEDLPVTVQHGEIYPVMRERTFKGDREWRKTKERERRERRMNMWGFREEREEEKTRKEGKGKRGIGKKRINIHERSNLLPQQQH